MKPVIVAIASSILLSGVAAAQQSARNAATPNTADRSAKPKLPQPVSPLEQKSDTPVDKAAEARIELLKGSGAPIDPKSYIIGAEDILMVRVWRDNDISGLVAVRPDGKISLPLVNEVTAAGSTPEQLTNDIKKRLEEYMNNPEVTVAVQQVNSKKYYINGEVAKPGAYPLVVPTRIMEALVNAGGFREFANLKNITILRGTQKVRFNYKQVVDGKNPQQNIFLEPGDQIIVR